MSVFVMLLSAGAIIGGVRFGLVAGIEQIARALKWSPKTRGQATGYATSTPEFVALVGAGLAGVWEAGLWNVASSNLINAALMFTAVVRHRRLGDLLNVRFVDEIGFAALGIAAPLLLMRLHVDRSWAVVPILLLLFAVYRLADRWFASRRAGTSDDGVGSLPLGLILSLTALVVVGVAGVFLGRSTQVVVQQMGMHPALAGWLLGAVTSLPEVVTFFAVYDTAEHEDRPGRLAATQEVLDNLAASNMANTGLVYPLGLATFLIATA